MRKLIIGILTLAVSALSSDVYATFTVHAKQSANLAFSSSGIIDKVLVDVSSKVKKGDILAKLQNRDLKAMLAISKTTVKYAKLDLDRQIKVKHIIDQSKFDQFSFKYENAKAQQNYQQSLLNKTILRAPFDGVIYDKLIEVGDVVSGQMIKTAFKIQSKSKAKLVLGFDQKYWKSVKVGQTFKYGVDGDSKIYEGKISKIYPFANSGNRKIKAEVEVSGFIVGLFGEGYILTSESLENK